MTYASEARIVYPFENREDALFDIEDRGYISNIYAVCGGKSYPIQFCTIARLSSDLSMLSESGTNFVADPGLIIVDRLNETVMNEVVRRLQGIGFFDNLVPLSKEELLDKSPGRWPPVRR